VQSTDPIGQHNPSQIGGQIVIEKPELMTWLTARLRFWIVASWLPPDEDESGVPA
jgi:hypothetical protein